MSDSAFPSQNDGYTITHTEHGIAVFGAVPLSELASMLESWEESYGYDQMRADIAHAIDANFVATDAEGAEAWREAIEERLAEQYDDPLKRWVHGCDAGQSALTIYHVLFGAPLARISRSGRPSEPTDAADFGRCVRLLDVAPSGWRERLDEVAAEYPAWEPIVENWPTLEALYVTDHEALTERLREVRHG